VVSGSALLALGAICRPRDVLGDGGLVGCRLGAGLVAGTGPPAGRGTHAVGAIEAGWSVFKGRRTIRHPFRGKKRLAPKLGGEARGDNVKRRMTWWKHLVDKKSLSF
jgi:hypothetical protein